MIIVLHEWEKFFYRILQKFTPTWYLQKFFGYDKAQIKREAKKNDSTDSNDKNNSSIAQNNRSRILGKSSFWQVIWITVKMAAAIFLFIYRQKNGLLNELLGGAEIGWTRSFTQIIISAEIPSGVSGRSGNIRQQQMNRQSCGILVKWMV